MQEESKFIEQNGFTYFSKINQNLEKVDNKFESKLGHLFESMKKMNHQVQSLTIDVQTLTEDNQQLRVRHSLFIQLYNLKD